MSEIAMPDWVETRLGSSIRVQGGFAFNSDDFCADGVPIVRMSDLDSGQLNLTGAAKVPHSLANQLTEFSLRAGDLLIGMSGSLENYAVVKDDDLPAMLNQRVGRFVLLDSRLLSYEFLVHLVGSDDYRRHIDCLAAGAAQLNVSSSQIESFKFSRPSFPEQRRIAEILSTLDEAIEQTEALIAKHQQIKAGLMHDLFTRGVTPDGHLRPARDHAPDLYKPSPLGWIPKEWEWDYLQNLTLKIVDGVHHTPSYVSHGVPFVTVKNLTASRSIDFEELCYVTQEDHREFIKRADPKPGDVLVTKDGTLGVSRIVESWHPEFSIFVSVAQLRPIPARLRPHMLHNFFDSGFYEKQMGGLSAGSGLKHIHLEHFRRFQIPLPSPEEQDGFAVITKLTDERIVTEELCRAKLHQQKHGLMHDLLTGKVRINATLSAQEDVA